MGGFGGLGWNQNILAECDRQRHYPNSELLLLLFCVCVSHQAFVTAQNQLTLPFLEQSEVRDLFKERMTELYDYPKYSCPFKRGSR